MNKKTKQEKKTKIEEPIYNIFESTMALPPSIKMKLVVEREHFKNSIENDALYNPLSLCIKEKLKKNSDVLATSKMILYYNCKFDRKNYDIVIGNGRIAMIPLPEEISTRIKEYNETGDDTPFEFEFYIPKSILLSSFLDKKNSS